MKSVDNLLSAELYTLAGYTRKMLSEKKASIYDNLVREAYSREFANFSCTLNWRRMAYLSVSESVKDLLGYEVSHFLDGGVDFTLRLVHPEDRGKLRKVHSAIFECYYRVPLKERNKLRFSYNFRVRTKGRTYLQLLRQSFFSKFDDDGKPYIENVNITDITEYKLDNNITLIVHRLSKTGEYVIWNKIAFSERNLMLSIRENEVLTLVQQGYTSKQIGEILCVSLETIKSHRKHILNKTGAKNLTQAINQILAECIFLFSLHFVSPFASSIL